MSVFTNPASDSADKAEEYIAAVLGLVADRDPVEVLGTTADTLRDLQDGLSESALTTPESPGKWSIRDVLQHLVDSELVWSNRLRFVLAQERPTLIGWDQDLWADRLGYQSVDAGDATRDFAVVRQINLRQLRRASPGDLDRVGMHSERGEESVRHMLKLYAGHDLLHIAQVKRIKAAVA